MNTYIFNGNLGKDCEVRTTKSGTTVCSFSVAVQDGYGEKQQTKWVKCALFGKRAEGKLPQFLTSGTKVLIKGVPNVDVWNEHGSGNARGQLSVMVDEIELLSASQEPMNKPQSTGGFQQPAPGGFSQQPQQPAPGGFDDFDDGIPF